jgi:hypothetical protein
MAIVALLSTDGATNATLYASSNLAIVVALVVFRTRDIVA